ncbi:MAG: hypothetical protein ACRDAI_08530 [Candidatus Rhabdochlamydia sp.]
MQTSEVQAQSYNTFSREEILQEGILNTSNGSRLVNRQNYSRFQKPILKALLGFSAANLAIAGSIVGYASYAESEATGWSMPFFANCVLGLFGIIAAKNFQSIASEEPRALIEV